MAIRRAGASARIVGMTLILLWAATSAARSCSAEDGGEGSSSNGLADSPWPMLGGDLQHTGTSEFSGKYTDIGVKWKFLTKQAVETSITVGEDGSVYFGTGSGNTGKDDLYALNSDGTLRWKLDLGGAIYSTPALAADGTIYVGAGRGGDSGWFVAVNHDGTIEWKFEMEDGVYSSPAIAPDGTIYFGSHDDHFYALHPNGTLKWKYLTGETIWSSPALADDGTVFGVSDTWLYAFNPDGSVKWTLTLAGYANTAPMVGHDGTIYVTSDGGTLQSISPDGRLNWQVRALESTPALGKNGVIHVGAREPVVCADGSVIVGNNDYLCQLTQDGELLWQMGLEDVMNTPLSMGSDGTIYVGMFESVYAIGEGGDKHEAEVFPIDEKIPYYYGHSSELPFVYTFNSAGQEVWNFTADAEARPEPTTCDHSTGIPGFGGAVLLSAIIAVLVTVIVLGAIRRRSR